MPSSQPRAREGVQLRRLQRLYPRARQTQRRRRHALRDQFCLVNLKVDMLSGRGEQHAGPPYACGCSLWQ